MRNIILEFSIYSVTLTIIKLIFFVISQIQGAKDMYYIFFLTIHLCKNIFKFKTNEMVARTKKHGQTQSSRVYISPRLFLDKALMVDVKRLIRMFR